MTPLGKRFCFRLLLEFMACGVTKSRFQTARKKLVFELLSAHKRQPHGKPPVCFLYPSDDFSAIQQLAAGASETCNCHQQAFLLHWTSSPQSLNYHCLVRNQPLDLCKSFRGRKLFCRECQRSWLLGCHFTKCGAITVQDSWSTSNSREYRLGFLVFFKLVQKAYKNLAEEPEMREGNFKSCFISFLPPSKYYFFLYRILEEDSLVYFMQL